MLFGSRRSKPATANGVAAAPPPPAEAAKPQPAARTSPPHTAAGGAAAVPAAPAEPRKLSPEEASRRADASHRMMQTFGAVVAVLMRSPPHRELKLSEIEAMVGPAVMAGQVSLAEATHKQHGMVTPVAVVLWAAVSEAVDRRLTKSVAHPLRLAAAEWKSGPVIWIVEAVGDARMTDAMIKRLLAQAWTGRTVKVRGHGTDGKPMVRELATAPSTS